MHIILINKTKKNNKCTYNSFFEALTNKIVEVEV